MDSLEHASELDARGVVLLGRSGVIEFASPPARRLLRGYFGHVSEDELPTALTDWSASPARTFVLRRGRRCLTIERAGHALLLTETVDELGLTAREQQILASASSAATAV